MNIHELTVNNSIHLCGGIELEPSNYIYELKLSEIIKFCKYTFNDSC